MPELVEEVTPLYYRHAGADELVRVNSVPSSPSHRNAGTSRMLLASRIDLALGDERGFTQRVRVSVRCREVCAHSGEVF